MNEYAVGKNADLYPDGVGKLIKAGTTIDMNIHQHSIGEEIKAGVSVAFKFYPKGVVPQHVAIALHTADSYDGIDIPAGTAVRFEPGATHTVELVPFAGARIVRGGQRFVDGPLDADGARERFRAALEAHGFDPGSP